MKMGLYLSSLNGYGVRIGSGASVIRSTTEISSYFHLLDCKLTISSNKSLHPFNFSELHSHCQERPIEKACAFTEMTSHPEFGHDTKATEVADAFSRQIKDRIGTLSLQYSTVYL